MTEPTLRLPATLFLRQLYTAFGDPPERGVALPLSAVEAVLQHNDQAPTNAHIVQRWRADIAHRYGITSLKRAGFLRFLTYEEQKDFALSQEGRGSRLLGRSVFTVLPTKGHLSPQSETQVRQLEARIETAMAQYGRIQERRMRSVPTLPGGSEQSSA